MNEIKLFENPSFGKVRTIIKDGDPWFIAADVCKALKIQDGSTATSRLDDDEKGTTVLTRSTSGGNPNVTIVNESGLYSLVLGSRKPEARDFKRWITHEVIPSIRKHGMYATPQAAEAMLNDPDVMIRVLQEVKSEREQRKALEAKVEQDAPKVRFAESVEGSDTNILIGTLAKLMKQNGIDIGEKRLFQRMREDGFLCRAGERTNLPTQYAMEMKLFEVTERTFSAPDGSTFIRPTTKVTGKGQIYFMNRYAQRSKAQ